MTRSAAAAAANGFDLLTCEKKRRAALLANFDLNLESAKKEKSKRNHALLVVEWPAFVFVLIVLTLTDFFKFELNSVIDGA
jgi:hypothetical protein